MSQTYLLPCPECGEQQPVTARNAGASLTCRSCDSSIEVPKLGELRQLEMSGEDASKSAKGPAWDLRKGLVFASGMLFLIIMSGGAIGLILYAENSYITENQYEVIKKDRFKEFDNMPTWQLYSLFSKQVETSPPDDWEESIFLKNARIVRKFYYWAYAMLAIGITGGAITMFAATRIKTQSR